MKAAALIPAMLVLAAGSVPADLRINQEGRILGPLPVVTAPLLFNTTNADAVIAAMQIFPVTNPWNEDVSRRPRLANSDAMIAQMPVAKQPSNCYILCGFSAQ